MRSSFRSAMYDGWRSVFISLSISLLISMDGHAQQPLATRGSFKPMLVSATISADMVNPGDELIVTLAWQNRGTRGSAIPLKGFVELQFGHQRIEETLKKDYRYYYELFPDPSEWKEGNIWKVSCKIPISTREFWGGSYEVRTGLCNADNDPYPFKGKKGVSTMQEMLGEVQIGWGYGSLAVAGTRRPIQVSINSPAVPSPEMAKGSEPIVLGGRMKVKVARHRPLLLSLADRASFFEFTPQLPFISVRDLKTNALVPYDQNLLVHYEDAAITPQSVIYLATVSYKGKTIIHFQIQFAVKEMQLEMNLLDVKEDKNFELLKVRWPSLVSITGKDANLVDFIKGGRLIPIEKASPVGYTHRYDVRGAAAMYDHAGVIAVETTCLDDDLQVSVQENQNGKYGVLGVVLTNRVQAKARGLSSIKIDGAHRVTVAFLHDTAGAPSWKSAARFWQKDLQRKNFELYRRALVYKMVANFGPADPKAGQTGISPDQKKAPGSKTFDQILDNAKQLGNLFDGVKQILYVVGFQDGGADNGYPFTLKTDPRSGTVADLVRCIQEAKKYNIVYSLHDNFDDAYLSPGLDTNLLARDAYDRLWKGWIWAGGQSYIISPVKYWSSGKMQDRVKRTIATYGIHTSYHTDVLSSEVLRYDYTPGRQAGADLSMKHKAFIPGEFNKYGIDLTSETLIHPLVGHIGYAWSTRDNRQREIFPGETYIPLTAMVYHGAIGFSESFDQNDEISLLWALLKGSGFSDDDLTPAEAKQFYLLNLPTGLLYEKVMKDFIIDGADYKAVYDDSTWVKCNMKDKSYEVMYNGSLIAKNWSSFAPGFSPKSYLAYTVKSGRIQYPAPGGWYDGIKLKAVTLTTNGEGPMVSATVSHGMVELEIPLNTPVRITCSDESNPPPK